jgi:hypothetical protein
MRFAFITLGSLAVCTGCSTTSTITRVDQPTVEDHIVGGDAENVYVGEKEAPQTIPRSQIKDIDYPGDGAAVAGSILSGYGVVNIAVGAPLCDQKGAAFCTGVFLPLGIGLPILIWGIATHASAVGASHTPLQESASRLFFTPVVGTEKGQPSGAAVMGVF